MNFWRTYVDWPFQIFHVSMLLSLHLLGWIFLMVLYKGSS
jgi:hypothetical protein